MFQKGAGIDQERKSSNARSKVHRSLRNYPVTEIYCETVIMCRDGSEKRFAEVYTEYRRTILAQNSAYSSGFFGGLV